MAERYQDCGYLGQFVSWPKRKLNPIVEVEVQGVLEQKEKGSELSLMGSRDLGWFYIHCRYRNILEDLYKE